MKIFDWLKQLKSISGTLEKTTQEARSTSKKNFPVISGNGWKAELVSEYVIEGQA